MKRRGYHAVVAEFKRRFLQRSCTPTVGTGPTRLAPWACSEVI
jgi:hypothetical protein